MSYERSQARQAKIRVANAENVSVSGISLVGIQNPHSLSEFLDLDCCDRRLDECLRLHDSIWDSGFERRRSLSLKGGDLGCIEIFKLALSQSKRRCRLHA